MLNWRKLKVGQNIRWIIDDFDGYTEMIAEVVEVYEDHVIAIADGIELWIDDNNSISN